MTKVKITVLKTDFYPDLAAEYGKPELGPCAAMKVGDVFYADVKCPEGFCHTSWNCIYQYIMGVWLSPIPTEDTVLTEPVPGLDREDLHPSRPPTGSFLFACSQ